MPQPEDLIRNLRIARPCAADWSAMKGDGQARFCEACQHNVYNFAGLSQDEAAQLLLAKEGRICGRFYKRPDGTLMTRDCPLGTPPPAGKRIPLFAVGVLLLSALGAAITRFAPADARTSAHNPNPNIEQARRMPVIGTIVNWIYPEPEIVMGVIAPTPSPSSGTSGP